MNPLLWLAEIDIAGVIDIAIMSLLIYAVLVWLNRTKRAAAILTGIIIVGLIYLFAKLFNLTLTAGVLQSFFTVFLIALIVIFQEELRYFFEQIANWGLHHRSFFPNPATQVVTPDPSAAITRTAIDFSKRGVGALIVIRGGDLLVRHLDGGEELNGQLSEPLLQSIFDPSSEGHDGAVIVRGEIVEQFGCRLPLSKNQEELRGLGTRHAAALGLSELTDALCLVVSEENGKISVAQNSELETVHGSDELHERLMRFHRKIYPPPRRHPWSDFIRKNSREKLIAILLAMVLWFVLVHESRVVFRTFDVPVDIPPLPSHLVATEVQPRRVSITLSGLRKDFFFNAPGGVTLSLGALEPEPGSAVVPITDSHVRYPGNLNLERIDPPQVIIRIESKSN